MKKILWQLLGITVLAAVFVVMIVYQPTLFLQNSQPQTSSSQPESSKPSMPEPEPEPEPVTVRMVMAGDNLIHDTLYLQAQRRAADGGYDFSPVYENIRELVVARHDF